MHQFSLHLPSNVQPSRFPNNTAGDFSTQLDQPITLDGEYEVALTEISYPNSIRLFKDQGITFTVEGKTCQLHADGKHVNKLTIRLQNQRNDDGLMSAINAKSNGLFHLSMKGDVFELQVFRDDVLIRLQKLLAIRLGFRDQRDFMKGTFRANVVGKGQYKNAHITVVDLRCFEKVDILVKHQDTVVKDKKALIALLKKEFNGESQKLTLKGNYLHWTKNAMIHDAMVAFRMNKMMRQALGFGTLEGVAFKGVYKASNLLSIPTLAKYSGKWLMTTYVNKMPKAVTSIVKTHWPVPSPMQNKLPVLISVLNQRAHEFQYKFSIHYGKVALELFGDTSMEMDKEVAYVLGFTWSTFMPHMGTFYAEREPSLYSDVDYVFVYNNISDYVNVGHMRSPLLHALPFLKAESEHLIHHTITNPIYRPVIAQSLDRIDIKLCDGNGRIIPFGNGKTLVTLHMRRRYF